MELSGKDDFTIFRTFPFTSIIECPFSCKYNLDPELKQQRRQQMTSGFLERLLTPSEDIEPQHYQQ